MISTAYVSASNRKGNTAFGYGNQHAIKKADIGIVVADATYAARSASEIILTEPDLSVTISAMLTSRAIFQRMENYMNHIVRNADITLSYVPVGDRWQLYLEMLVEHWRFADSMEGISNALVLSPDEMQRHPDSEKIIVTKKLQISVGNPIIHTIRKISADFMQRSQTSLFFRHHEGRRHKMF